MTNAYVSGMKEDLNAQGNELNYYVVDFIGSDLKILVPLAVILVVLLFRPTGLFGSAEVARA